MTTISLLKMTFLPIQPLSDTGNETPSSCGAQNDISLEQACHLILGQLKFSRIEKIMSMLKILLDLLISISVAMQSWNAEKPQFNCLGLSLVLPSLIVIHLSPMCLGQHLCDYNANLLDMY